MLQAVQQYPIGLNHPGPAMLAYALAAILMLRFGKRTERACAMVFALTIMLHGLAWFFYGLPAPVHLACDLVAISFLLPIALRTQRYYPAALCSAWLVSLLFQAIAIGSEIEQRAAAGILAATAQWLALIFIALAMLRGWWGGQSRHHAAVHGSSPE